MASGLCVFFLVAVMAIDGLCLSSLTEPDRARLKRVFDGARPYQDLATAHYAVLSYILLGETIPNSQDVCKYVQGQVDPKNVESIFYATGLSKALGNCQLTNVAALKDSLNAAIVEGITSQNLYFVVTALKNLNLPYDSNKISKILTAARKKDDGALSLGYALHVASQLTTDVTSFSDWIEDVVVQADEIDGRLLQFEGGLSVSAIVVSGVYRLADKNGLKSLPAIDGDKCLKFANYFVSRKQVQVVRPAYHLLDILQTLSSNKIHIPVSISLASSSFVPVTQPAITIRVSNLLGSEIGQLAVTLESAQKIGTKGSTVINKQLQPVKDNKQLYDINLSSAKLKHGRYQLNINAKPIQPDTRLVGISGAQVSLKLETEIVFENMEIGVGDVDQSSAPRLTPVQYPGKLPTVLEVDYHQKVQMKFQLKDKLSKDSLTVHQAFVVLTHAKTSREIIFVAEPDSTSNVYKFDLDIHAKTKDFGSLSGSYGLSVIIGDAVISNPISWQLGDVEITFQESVVPQIQTAKYEPKPEIKHVFREPDKRPSPLVSNAFTILGLVPLLLLFVLWYKIGINVSNFNLSLASVGFHLGLAGIFGLFIVFWLKLAMFETLKYLILLGIVTFLCGNSMLSKLAGTHKQ